MKTWCVRALSLCLLVVLTLGLSVPAGAASIPEPDVEIQASDYFGRRNVIASAAGSGKLQIVVDVVAKGIMQEVGATKVTVYEQQSNGSYSPVHTYTRYNTPALIQKNRLSNKFELTYQGKSGTYYYAVAACYAKNASGSEQILVTSEKVKV